MTAMHQPSDRAFWPGEGHGSPIRDAARHLRTIDQRDAEALDARTVLAREFDQAVINGPQTVIATPGLGAQRPRATLAYVMGDDLAGPDKHFDDLLRIAALAACDSTCPALQAAAQLFWRGARDRYVAFHEEDMAIEMGAQQ